MRVQSLRTWLAVPLLLALPAVMALVSAAETEAGAPADNSLHGKLPMNTSFDRNILGHEAYAGAAAKVDLEFLDPEAGAPRESDPKRPPRSSQTDKRKSKTHTKPSSTAHQSSLRTTASSATRPQRSSTGTSYTTPSPRVPHSTPSPRASRSSQHPRASDSSGVPSHTTRPSRASTTVISTPSPTTTTRTDDPIIVWPFPDEPTSDTTHPTTATRTASGTVSATPSVSVSASDPTETSGGTATQSSRVSSPTGSPTTPDNSPSGPSRSSSATLTASSTGPRGTGTISRSVSGSSTMTATASKPTGVSSRVTTAPPRSTMTTTTTTTTTTKTKATKTKTHKPSKTKTPWLPSSIEPVKPPKITATPSPGTSLPDVVIPNLKPKIPKNNFPVNLRFQQVSYYQVINNGILAAQLVNFIPAQLAPLLGVAEDKILVLAIRDGRTGGSSSSSSSSPSRRAKKRALVTTQDEDDSIRVVVSIPQSKYWTLNELVSNRHSALYTPTADGFGQYLDWNYPLSNRPPPPVASGSKGNNGNGNGGNHNPLTGDHLGAGDPDQVGNSSSPKTAVIGSLIGLATVAYVGIALVVVRMVRRKKLREQEAQAKMSPKNISAPVRVQGGSQGWGWQGN